MSDLPIKTPKTDFPVENSKSKPVTPVPDKDAPPDQAAEVVSRFVMKLPVEDFKSLKVQKNFTEEAVMKANEAQAETFRRQVIANMMQAAYNAAWRIVQQKHGLPESLDVDWADGSVYRKNNES